MEHKLFGQHLDACG